jgi:hypothetical protein
MYIYVYKYICIYTYIAYGYDKVKAAFLQYKSLFGDLLVPDIFVVPVTEDWPEELWGMKLGACVCLCII